MVNPTIVSLIIDGALAAMQVKNHFDIKKLQTGVSQLLGELPIKDTRADDVDFASLLYQLRKDVGGAEQAAILSLMEKLTPAEQNVFRALISSRRNGLIQMESASEAQKLRAAIDKERLDFLADLASMPQDEALSFLRTGVGISPTPGARDYALTYTKYVRDFIASETPRVVGWIKNGAVKTHATIFDVTPRKQSIWRVFLGKFLIGGTGGSIGTSTEVQFLNNLFATKSKTTEIKEV